MLKVKKLYTLLATSIVDANRCDVPKAQSSMSMFFIEYPPPPPPPPPPDIVSKDLQNPVCE